MGSWNGARCLLTFESQLKSPLSRSQEGHTVNKGSRDKDGRFILNLAGLLPRCSWVSISYPRSTHVRPVQRLRRALLKSVTASDVQELMASITSRFSAFRLSPAWVKLKLPVMIVDDRLGNQPQPTLPTR